MAIQSDAQQEEPVPVPRGRGRAAIWTVALLILLGVAFWWVAGRGTAVRLENRLSVPVVVTLPDGDSAVVEAEGIATVRLAGPGFARLLWQAGPLRSSGGAQHGHAVSGEVGIDAGRGTQGAVLSLAQARIPMFSPLITNGTDGPLRIVVNAGLEGATDCGCAVPAGAIRMAVGFYPLYRNTTVRAIDSAGRIATFVDLGPEVDPSGLAGLRFESANFR